MRGPGVTMWVWVLFSACDTPYTAARFEQDLFDLQCQIDTCHRADDSCASQMVQPRASDCAFDAELGMACLDAVEAMIDETPDMWETDGEATWCRCGDPTWHDFDWQGAACVAMPQADALPPECDVVCTDL